MTLSDDEVIAIRRLRREGMPHRKVARIFGVSATVALRVSNGDLCRHLDAIEPPIVKVSQTRALDPVFLAAQMGLPWETMRRNLISNS